ncbi:MAG: HD domain-containing protein [Caldimicrobium sp.]|nr:HD domain-containing protein [Caldimicrobium sp.]MCX7872857.1 HD domain-containing protein [Caldimicrobium sp.]MDW8093564.1 HD domain-containing protein [Caldimicrobium sp.]
MEFSIDWAYELLREEGVPSHIIRHSEKVALISLCLGCLLKERGNSLDIKALTLAGLLHDIKKFSSIKTGENHALAGYKLMKNLGFERIGEIIYAHIYLKAPKPGSPISEEEIVFYADKRVMHDRIVNLKERFQDLERRYGRTLRAIIRMRLLEEMTLLLERRIFRNLEISPDIILKLNEIQEVRSVLERLFENCPDSWRQLF